MRTLFRMPDLLSIGLGGGTEVSPTAAASARAASASGCCEKALVFGGDTLTATDIAVAAGRIDLGDRSRVAAPAAAIWSTRTLARMGEMIAEAVDRMKTEAGDVPLLAVGGGSFLIPDRVEGCSGVIRVEHHAVANAVGAAIAQVSGEVDQVFSGMTRDQALQPRRTKPKVARWRPGCANTLKIVELEDIPLSYLPGDARRVRVRMVGDIASSSGSTTSASSRR